MAIVVTRSMVLHTGEDEFDVRRLNGPVIGWQNLITFGGITADSEDVDFPVDNLANPATTLLWRSLVTTTQYVAIQLTGIHEIDYVGLARHNLGRALIPVGVEARVGTSSDWTPIAAEFILPDDNPTIVRFPVVEASEVRLRFDAGLEPPEIAVVYVGRLLQLQRNIYVGHTPINYGRQLRVTNGCSERGQFLGRIVTGKNKRSGVSLQNLTARWVRARLEPFLAAAEELPFFFAWRPDGYPREVGYCWLTEDAVPVNQRGNGMMQVDLALAGIAGDSGDVVVVE